MKRLTFLFFIAFAIIGSPIYAQVSIPAAPSLVFDANPGSADGGASNITSVGDRVYYEANGTLWMYDGTTAGAVNFGTDLYSRIVGVFNDNIYLEIDNQDGSFSLVLHDGTSISVVANLGTSDRYYENNFAVYNDFFYFVAEEEIFGSEVWKTDGSTTTRVTDLANGTGNSDPKNLIVLDGKLYFTAISNTERELYTYNGTTVTLINSVSTGYTSVPDENTFSIASFNSDIYFTAYNATNGNDIWKYDGTYVTWFNNTRSGSDSNPRELTTVDFGLTWVADGSTYPIALYKYTGTVISIYEAAVISEMGNLSNYNGQLLFKMFFTSTNSDHIQLFNGSSFGDLVSAPSIESFLSVGSYIYYNEELDPGINYKLSIDDINNTYVDTWEINPSGNEIIGNLTVHNSELYFEGDDGVNGKELWKLRSSNFLPEVMSAKADTAVILFDNTVTLDLSNAFVDKDRDDFTLSVISSNTSILEAVMVGEDLTLTFNAVGSSTVTVTATDEFGGEGSFTFNVGVKNPYLTYTGDGFSEPGINDGSLMGEMYVKVTGDSFANAGGTLTEGTQFTINNLPAGLVPNVQISAGGDSLTVTLTGQANSHSSSDNVSNLNFTFTDAAFVENPVTVIDNSLNTNSGVSVVFDFYKPPTVIYNIGAITRTKPADSITYYLGDIFENPGSYDLTVTASSSDETVAKVILEKTGLDEYVGYDLTIIPDNLGTSEITINVTTEHGATASQTFEVRIDAPTLDYNMDVTFKDDLQLTQLGRRRFYDILNYNLSPDGTKITRPTQFSYANQINLNEANDLTAGATTSEYNGIILAANETDYKFHPYDLGSGSSSVTFNNDGTKVFIMANEFGKYSLTQFSLAVSFDLRSEYTVDFRMRSDSTGSAKYPFDYEIRNMIFSADGMSMFHFSYDTQLIHQVQLASPFDISGGLTEGATFSTADLSEAISFRFNEDGTALNVFESDVHTVQVYHLASAYDLTTAPTLSGSFTLDISGIRDSPSSTYYTDNFLFSKNKKQLFVVTWEDGANYLQQFSVDNTASGFSETEANLGELEGKLLITTNGDQFVNAGGTLSEGVHYSIDNMPDGLVPNMQVSADGYQLSLTWEGSASDHDDSNNIADLQITFNNAAFKGGDASVFANSTASSTGYGIQFTDNPIPSIDNVIADTAAFTGLSLQYNLSEYFSISTEEMLAYTVLSGDETVATASVAGSSLTIGALESGSTSITVTATSVTGNSVSQTFNVDVLKPYITFESASTGFVEVEENDGAVQGELLLGIIGDRFENAGDNLELGTQFTINDLPEGLTPNLTVAADGLSAVLTLTGKAVNNDVIDNVENLTITFEDAAFVTNQAANFVNAIEVSTGYGITFIAEDFEVTEIEDIVVGFSGTGTGLISIDLSFIFTDVAKLTFTVSSSNESVASVEIVDGVLQIAPKGIGFTIISITATRTSGGRVESRTTSFKVDVTELVTALTDELRNLRIYPNPTTNDFKIDLGAEYSNIIVEISDLTGQVISRQSYPTIRAITSTIKGERGVYMISIVGDQVLKSVHRIIKK